MPNMLFNAISQIGKNGGWWRCPRGACACVHGVVSVALHYLHVA